MRRTIAKSFLSLKDYCESENFAGWDPFDGLNSRVFQATPLKHWELARLAWIQGFKRSPVNFRKLLFVAREHNCKGIGLFLTGYCNLYRTSEKTRSDDFGNRDEILEKINYLAGMLIDMKAEGYSGACWGYNFDWQSRVFFQPRNTPTIVATSFCADSLFNAFEITGNNDYLKTALSSCDFIVKDLNRTVDDYGGIIFSYSPLDRSRVYNASLLGARLLARGFHYTGNKEWEELSLRAAHVIVKKQSEDGSWIYGEDKVQNWVDSFHTGYNLECIWEIMKFIKNRSFDDSFRKGMDYYLLNFFLHDGTPKYFNNRVYPIDIHCPAQLLATLSRTGNYASNKLLAEKVLCWTIDNMQSTGGYFYYQLKRVVTSKIPYMRWAQAWMFYAFTESFKSIAYENLD